ncbi:valine--tRNA ligase [Taibaiella soli]|uniref:Valine--tRNA ligase n=1 Tax=Taibaiella soli TaxID=1649169 RepID=A0A2W2BEE6_9BACT|nr:valine--tRNA ligase [Taibaiella soli]PZF71966.1 valine--tRNA ligase [Taibaiella soli]
MELSKNFQHRESELQWYEHWNQAGYFHSVPDERPAYTIVMPPPNVTGVLHMGHALNNTVQDVLIRRAKMQGFNTCWVPGTDHASIATEAKVVAMLREKGIDKKDLSRDEFLKYAWEWKEKYGGIILQQLKKLGCALDWDRTHFTMDKDYYAAVIRVFLDLYNKGLIYRGVKMINWDPRAKTALSDEEVIFKQTNSKLYYVQYRLDTEREEYITIATVRPETILGDTAICVHPNDPRYAHLKGKFAFVPLINRRIPIIFDEYIDMEFGTGALKVTPAHDLNDYNLGLKHNLPVIDTLNDDGTMSEAATLYIGEDRFAVRKKIVVALKESGNLIKEEEYTNQVGHSERTDAVIEPRLSMQWWCKMEDLAKPALEAVMEDDIAFYPAKFKNLYRHWMGNIKDWCISRQLWWGHRIPAWYTPDNKMTVAATLEEAFAELSKSDASLTIDQIRQEDDCLDTWFSSWLWPMEVFGWNENPNNADLQYYYPTSTLVTAPEIIFFWVARMIMSGYEYMGKKPFDKVYFTGIVRDKQGRKMSKSLGNSPDLLALIDDFGADAVRFSVMISSPAGNDLLFDESQLEQGRNFSNKIWNAMKLVKGWEERVSDETSDEYAQFAIHWMEQRIAETGVELEAMFKDFRLSEALKTIYTLIWNDFCSWYLEWVKPGFEQPVSAKVFDKTISIFEQLLQLLHPYMPFVTEEIYHLLRGRKMGDDLMPLAMPAYNTDNATILKQGAMLQDVITSVRDARNKNQFKPKDQIILSVDTQHKDFYNATLDILQRQVNAEEIKFTSEQPASSIAVVVNTDKLYIEAFGKVIDFGVQKEQLAKDLEYLKGFLASVDKKLSNERFVSNAKPEIIEAERKKQSDAQAKIKVLEESLSSL